MAAVVGQPGHRSAPQARMRNSHSLAPGPAAFQSVADGEGQGLRSLMRAGTLCGSGGFGHPQPLLWELGSLCRREQSRGLPCCWAGQISSPLPLNPLCSDILALSPSAGTPVTARPLSLCSALSSWVMLHSRLCPSALPTQESPRTPGSSGPQKHHVCLSSSSKLLCISVAPESCWSSSCLWGDLEESGSTAVP